LSLDLPPKGGDFESKLLLKYAGDSVAANVLAENREELELHRKYSAYFGCLFLAMQVGLR